MEPSTYEVKVYATLTVTNGVVSPYLMSPPVSANPSPLASRVAWYSVTNNGVATPYVMSGNGNSQNLAYAGMDTVPWSVDPVSLGTNGYLLLAKGPWTVTNWYGYNLAGTCSWSLLTLPVTGYLGNSLTITNVTITVTNGPSVSNAFANAQIGPNSNAWLRLNTYDQSCSNAWGSFDMVR